MQDVIPGVSDPVIYISVTEKGAVDVELTARGVQAHSSYPHEESAVGILSRWVHQDTHYFTVSPLIRASIRALFQFLVGPKPARSGLTYNPGIIVTMFHFQ